MSSCAYLSHFVAIQNCVFDFFCGGRELTPVESNDSLTIGIVFPRLLPLVDTVTTELLNHSDF